MKTWRITIEEQVTAMQTFEVEAESYEEAEMEAVSQAKDAQGSLAGVPPSSERWPAVGL